MAIIANFVVFIAFIICFTVFASRQKMDLVRHDYYDDEVRYQQQLDRLNRTQPLAPQLAVQYDAARRQITIALPSAHAGKLVTGEIRFYRPSEERLDRDVQLAVDAQGVQRVDARALQAGHWKVRVYWKVDGQEYFFTRPLLVGAHDS